MSRNEAIRCDQCGIGISVNGGKYRYFRLAFNTVEPETTTALYLDFCNIGCLNKFVKGELKKIKKIRTKEEG